MPQATGETRFQNRWLFIGLGIYGLVNLMLIEFAPAGLIPSIFDSLYFFTFIGPILGIVVVLTAQVVGKPRPFTWLAIIGVIVALMLLAFVNIQILVAASAAV
jgi:hypothetical protein